MRSQACQTPPTIYSITRPDAGCKSYTSSVTSTSHSKPRTSSVNNDFRLAERKREFDVGELRRLAAQSVSRSPRDIDTFVKLAEGGFNRTFLITMRDGFEMIARIPYPVTVPKYYAVASEVATMDFLRSSGLPTPQVYGYSPVEDNAAQTEYIFMEFMKGAILSGVWPQLEGPAIASIMRQVVQLESQMMSLSFTAGGSLYYTSDLLKVAGKATVPLEDGRFCIGPDTRVHMWYGRRSQLDVDRGPCMSLYLLSLNVMELINIVM